MGWGGPDALEFSAKLCEGRPVTNAPDPPPEGVLIEAARQAAGMSAREAARRAGISEGWWRQVVRGYQTVPGGGYGPVRGPSATIARMAIAAGGITPEQMKDQGQRPDAAAAMEMIRTVRAAAGSESEAAPIAGEARVAAQPYADAIEDRYDAAVVRTGNPDPPGSEIFGASDLGPADPWAAEAWERLRHRHPSVLRRIWIIASATVPEEGEPGREHGSAAGLAPGRAGGAA